MEKLYVIKIGGNILNNKDILQECLNQLIEIKEKIILVHGGGAQLNEFANAMGIPQKKVEGRRITTSETRDLALMVYSGLINKKIVSSLTVKGKKAIGLCGADVSSIIGKKREISIIDYGLVGDISADGINTNFIASLLSEKITPVFSSITMDQEGELLNTNADTIAATLAVSLSSLFEVNLIYCFEKNGVLKDIDDDDSTIQSVNPTQFKQLTESGVITDGMIPKLENSFLAIEQGVKEVKITLGKELKEAVYDNNFSGTKLIA